MGKSSSERSRTTTKEARDSVRGRERVSQRGRRPRSFAYLTTPGRASWEECRGRVCNVRGRATWEQTMLAKAVATECKTTFFNISASSIVSKWRGDSEKLVRVLFELARHHAPSTIFLDEIDAIISQRGEARSEHEASRRLKTELLIQMDGLTKTDELVFVLAATNLPWELDAAMLRRLEKRILVPLPEPEARQAMFEEFLSSSPGEAEIPYDYLVEKTEGYSGSDIRLVCKEAAMQPLRRLILFLESQPDEVPEDELPAVGPVTPEDIEVALRNTRPSAHLQAHRYEKFNQDYGSQILS